MVTAFLTSFQDGTNVGFITHYSPHKFIEHIAKIGRLIGEMDLERSIRSTGAVFSLRDENEKETRYSEIAETIKSATELEYYLRTGARDRLNPLKRLYYRNPLDYYYSESPLDYILLSPLQNSWRTNLPLF